MDSKDAQKLVKSLQDIRSSIDSVTREVKQVRKSLDVFTAKMREDLQRENAEDLTNRIKDPLPKPYSMEIHNDDE